MSGFQTQINVNPAPAVVGDFASGNPRTVVLSNEGGLVTGASGVTVGTFAWVAADGITAQSRGSHLYRAPAGFCHREQQALITAYQGESSLMVPCGFPVVLHNSGDFWVKNDGASTSAVGDTLYVNYKDGKVTTGSAAASGSATGSVGATMTASGSGVNLTASAVTGVISVGDTLSGTGIPVGTTVRSQTSGISGGAGVYVTSVATTASAATVTSFGDTLTVSAVASGSLDIGEPVTGTGIPSGALLASQVSGAAGGAGTYELTVAASAYAPSTALTIVGGVTVSKFKAASVAAPGELMKISSYL